MTFTFDELKLARERGYSDDEIWNTLVSEDKEIGLAKERGYSLEEVASITSGQPIPEAAPAQPATLTEGAEDIGRKFLMGGAGGIRSITDVFGANNPVSKAIAGVEDYIAEGLSAESQQNSERISKMFDDAESKGLGAKVAVGLEAFASAPAETLAQVGGYMIPNLAAGVLGKAAKLGKLGMTAAQAATGAAMGMGTAKGEIYSGVTDYLREQGVPEDQIHPAATKAQETFGKNMDQILLATGIGAANALTGVEKIFTRILTRTGGEVTEKSIASVLKNGLKGAATETAVEVPQEMQEQVATNIALQREGAEVPTFRGAVQAGAMAAPAALLLGGAAGGVEVMTAEDKAEQEINRDADKEARSLSVPEGDTNAKVVVNEINRKENAITSLQEELDTLEPTDPRAQQLRLDIASLQKGKAQLKKRNKEPLTQIEEKQAELAAKIAAEPAVPVAAELSTTITEAPVVSEEGVQVSEVTPAPEAAAAPAVTTQPAPEAVTPAPEAAPEGIAVGNRIKLGKSPQGYVVEEVIESTPQEKELGEQYFRVKNERTGETQVVEQKDLIQIKPKRIRAKRGQMTPLPQESQAVFEDVESRVKTFFGGTIPSRVTITNNPNAPDTAKGSYDPETGIIEFNLAFIPKEDNIEDIVTHELGHFMFGDTKVKKAFDAFYNSLTPDEKAQVDKIVEDSYNEETGEVQLEEAQVVAFSSFAKLTPERTSLWNTVLDAIKAALNRVLGTNFLLSDPVRTAIHMVNAARRGYVRGREIPREGGRRMITQSQDARYAELEARAKAGDKEAEAEAQRMVDAEARSANKTAVRSISNEEGNKEADFPTDTPEDGIRWLKLFNKGTTIYFEELKSGNISVIEIETNEPLRKMGYATKAIQSLLQYADGNTISFGAFTQQGERYLKPLIKRITNGKISEENDFTGVYRLANENQSVEGLGETPAIISADPFTYDDAGNLIPLSQRFQPTTPDIRRAAEKPAVEIAPESPEGQSIPQALANGVDIGPENNMPVNRKIDSHIKNFAFLRGFFESATDRLRRNKFTRLADAIEGYYDQANRRLGVANKILGAALNEYAASNQKKRIEEDFQKYVAAQENKRDTDAIRKDMHPTAIKIVDAWQKFGEESGKDNQRVGVKVFDPAKEAWRKIGRVKKFWPRQLKPEYQKALFDPDKYSKEYNEIVDALIEDGVIENAEQAEKYIRQYTGQDYRNDYFSGIEVARGKPLPEKLYDYSMPVMTNYIARWAQHVSRIEAFGQKTTEQSKTLFDRELEGVRDKRTIDYIRAAQDRVENFFPNDAFLRGTAALNIWATGLQLGNPASAILNFVGGSTLNAMIGQPGALGSYAESIAELRKLGAQMEDAKEKGILSRDLMNIVGDHQSVLESNGFAIAGQKVSDFLLKWSGFTPVEQMIRTQSFIIGKSFLRKALDSNRKNPNGSFAKRSRAWLTRNRFDLDKLIVEEGTGPETDKLLRYFANIAQGSYTITQTPIFIDTPIGKFLFKYQKFSTQVMRMAWKNTFEPALKAALNKKQEVQLPDATRQLIYRLKLAEAKEIGDTRPITLATIPKTVSKAEARLATLIPTMMWLGSAYVGGEVLLRLRDILFGVLMKGPEYDDILKALEDDDDAAAMYLGMERAWYNLIGIGALGLLGNYAQFFLDWSDRERVKNPLDPPSLAIVKDTANLVTTIVDQGTLTAGDVNDFATKQVSAYRATKKLAQSTAGWLGLEEIPGVKQEMFRREVASINKYARRWAEESGIEYRMRRPGDVAATERTPINRKIAGYLQSGDPETAAVYAKEYLNSLPKKERANAIQSITAGARNRQPLRLGSGPMDDQEKKAFLRWLKDKVSEEKYQEVAELNKNYERDYDKFLRRVPNR
jgi:predicted metal-dependent hydrolase